ncbi:MAG TPA: nucleotide sugar dehydrogenase, partial [Candidatus Poseidoniia archaeon]|nr:nucleotide sugar dehydrogenase [Candidatus Poseidoniia archaeon]
EFSKKEFTVLGFDKDAKRVNDINAGNQIMKHINKKSMKKFAGNNGSATTEFSRIKDMDCLIICVPTPLDKHEQPDMSYVESASLEISKNLRKEQLIVLESTTYPGTTKEIVKPILEKSGLVAGKDFFLAYSPEREDPGNKDFSISEIPKVIGGLTENCLRLTSNLYKHIVLETVEVSTMETAE